MQDIRTRYARKIDIEYSHAFAKKMEQHKTNPVLGYRTAGSGAERETGNMIYEEMKRIGLEEVTRDYFPVDSWCFERANLCFKDEKGALHSFTLGAYQTQFDTNGPKQYKLVYVGKGKAKDYAGIDVRGKLVMADINQREEWWINYPVYQAYLRGAAAFIAVQENGYGEASRTTLNAQDIAGPKEAAAFSMSQADADIIKARLRNGGKSISGEDSRRHADKPDELTVTFDAKSTIEENKRAFNVIGKIPGRTDDMIMLSAHYDSYFNGFQDDNMAIGMLLSIAKTYKRIKYRPEKTIIFAAMAAEEWGAVNTKYDWSIGAYNEVMKIHPEWAGRMFICFNFELPAIASDKKDIVRCTYEYAHFIGDKLKDVDVPEEAFEEGIRVKTPILTLSDDFSIAISGIPSVVNEFASGRFMKTHYHTQFDNEDMYDEDVYEFHHELYGRLVMDFDELLIPPFDFRKLFAAMDQSLEDGEGFEFTEEVSVKMLKLRAMGGMIYECVEGINERYKDLLLDGEYERAEEMQSRYGRISELLFGVFKLCQDKFVRLDWHDEVIFPQESAGENIIQIREARQALSEGSAKGAMSAIYGIDNNRYAFLFEREVYEYFTDYVLNAPKERLFWGNGRIWHHVDMYDFVDKLKERIAGDEEDEADYSAELRFLDDIEEAQMQCYKDDVAYMMEKLLEVEARFVECIRLL